jgi:hypothetical protein
MNFSSGILTNCSPGGRWVSGVSMIFAAAGGAASRVQFLFPAFAAYIAWSAAEINWCGDNALSGKTAAPMLTVRDIFSRRPPVNR